MAELDHRLDDSDFGLFLMFNTAPRFALIIVPVNYHKKYVKLVLLNLVPKRHRVNPKVRSMSAPQQIVMVPNGNAPTKGFTTNGQYFQGIVV